MESVTLLIKEELERVNEEIFGITIESENIKKNLQELLQSGSKRIRSIVSAIYLKANNKKVSENSIHILTAGEIIHNASLLHDDVLDDASARRGKPSFNTVFSPNLSILTGDYLLSAATQKLLNIDNKEILQIFLKCTKEMCEAEINQFFMRGSVPAIEDYIKICEGKTASLFEAILESCAVIESLDREKAVRFAKNFGIFFQLKNDLTGQSIESDKKNKIFTPKDILGVEKTMDLIDNYQERIRRDIGLLPDNIYKEGLGELLKSL